MEGYTGTREGFISTEHMAGSFPEDRLGLPTYLQAYNKHPSGVLMGSALVIKIVENREIHHTEEGAVRVRYKTVSTSNKKAEIGSFPPLYP